MAQAGSLVDYQLTDVNALRVYDEDERICDKTVNNELHAVLTETTRPRSELALFLRFLRRRIEPGVRLNRGTT